MKYILSLLLVSSLCPLACADEFSSSSNPYQKGGYGEATPAPTMYTDDGLPIQGNRGYTRFQRNPGNDAADRNQQKNSTKVTGRPGEKRGPGKLSEWAKKAASGAGKYMNLEPATDKPTPGTPFKLQADKDGARPLTPQEGLEDNARRMFPLGTQGFNPASTPPFTIGASDADVTDFVYISSKADGKIHRIKFTYERYKNIIPGDGRDRVNKDLPPTPFDIGVTEVIQNSDPFVRMIGTYSRSGGNAQICDIMYFKRSNPQRGFMETIGQQAPNYTQYGQQARKTSIINLLHVNGGSSAVPSDAGY